MKRLATLGAISGMLAAVAGAAAQAPPTPLPDEVIADSAVAGRLDRHLRQRTAGGFAGSVLAVAGGQVVLHHGYGWTEPRRRFPITSRTQFAIGSISKQFTACAILKLAQEGRLRTADPIGRFFDDVPKAKREITIHQLLSHTSGLGQRFAAEGETVRAEAVRRILRTGLIRRPGSGFSDSDDGYTLLAAIVEIASGRDFEDYLRSELFEPAGLVATRLWGHFDDNNPIGVAQKRKELDLDLRVPNWGFRGATGIFSTTGDLYRWHQALQAGAVLDAAQRDRLFNAYAGSRAGNVGYGWFMNATPRGTRSYWTRGAESFGHNAVFVWLPDDDLVIAVASNAGDERGAPISRAVAEEVEAILVAASGGG